MTPVPELITGALNKWAEFANVEPLRIPGYWQDKEGFDTPADAKPVDGEKVVLFLHGGAFIALSAHPKEISSGLGRAILGRIDSAKRLFALEYRLTDIHPQIRNSFPGAIIDTIMGYNYLVNVIGFKPQDVIVIGNSAGASLAIGLVRYLLENGGPSSKLPGIPYALILPSPYVDVGTSHEKPGSTIFTMAGIDILPDPRKGLFLYARKAYCWPLGFDVADSNPYISPGSVHEAMPQISYKGFPRTIIISGGAERLLDQARDLRDMMARDMGEDQVLFDEEPDAIHDFIVASWEQPARDQALRRIGEWINSN